MILFYPEFLQLKKNISELIKPVHHRLCVESTSKGLKVRSRRLLVTLEVLTHPSPLLQFVYNFVFESSSTLYGSIVWTSPWGM